MFRILLVIIPLFIASSSLAKGWEEISHEDGVRVWSKEAKNSEIMMFRGQKTMNLPLSKVAFVLLNDNIEQKKRWIDRIEEFVIVERSETFGSAVTYSTYALPFPLSDRDFVIKSTRILDEKNQKVTLSIKSVKHPKYKADDSIGVRGQILNSSFILEGIEGTKKTRVTVEIQADPGGLLPDWIINMVNREWPYNTLMALEKETRRKDTRHHPLIVKEFAPFKSLGH